MADVNTLEEKLGEVLGLAQAAQKATETVAEPMAEAGEVSHWKVLGKLNEEAGEEEITELVEWALPIQERHFQTVTDCALKLAAEEDPYAE